MKEVVVKIGVAALVSVLVVVWLVTKPFALVNGWIESQLVL